jgi:phosphoribosyl-AMP cyclohydrolase
MGKIDNARNIEMKFEEDTKKFDPEEVYKGQPNPTKI